MIVSSHAGLYNASHCHLHPLMSFIAIPITLASCIAWLAWFKQLPLPVFCCDLPGYLGTARNLAVTINTVQRIREYDANS